MTPITIFTWGYYGWGPHTRQLVKAVDAVETSRGFNPPMFVDIRIKRAVRAAGFTGPAFEKLLGPDRHRWMKSLGNSHIKTRTPGIQIADPAAADALLMLAVESARYRQRLIFFCSCQWPKRGGKINCHRSVVAGLVLKAAKKHGVQVVIEEWPGGEPKQIDLNVTFKNFSTVLDGRWTVPLGKRPDLPEVAGLPWGSIATLHGGDVKFRRMVGPAISQKDGWALPVMFYYPNPYAKLSAYKKEAKKLRMKLGLNAASN
jgi:hypothetical protein